MSRRQPPVKTPVHTEEIDWLEAIASTLMNNKRYHRAEKVLERALLTVPTNMGLRLMLAKIMYRKGDYAKAKEITAEFSADNQVAKVLTGRILYKGQQYATAIRVFSERGS